MIESAWIVSSSTVWASSAKTRMSSRSLNAFCLEYASRRPSIVLR